MRSAGHVAFKISVVKSEGKRSVRKPRCRWKIDILVGFRNVGSDGVDWIQLT